MSLASRVALPNLAAHGHQRAHLPGWRVGRQRIVVAAAGDPQQPEPGPEAERTRTIGRSSLPPDHHAEPNPPPEQVSKQP